MKRISINRIAIAVGLAIFAVATWFAARPPVPPPLPEDVTTTASSSPGGTSSSPLSALSAVVPPSATKPGATKNIVTISITSPTSGAKWVIGSENTISWSKAAGVTGQMYLVNATSGTVAGWIQQNIAPGQIYFPWNTRDLSLGETNPQGKNVTPGTYFIEMKFSSPSVPFAESVAFMIVATATPQ
jgi:hypothetical protein